MNEIGKNIRFLREQRNWSQDQLAEALHVTRQTVSNYETGRSRPDVEMLTMLAAALDADVKEILYAPSDRETHIRRLRRLAVSAVVTALVGILEAAGRAWGQQLMQESYIMSVSYLVAFLVHPLLYLLLGWTLARGCLVLLRANPPTRRWTVWVRWVLLAVIAAWLVVMAPFFLYQVDLAYLELSAFYSHEPLTLNSSFLLNVVQATILRHPKALGWCNLLLGGLLGLLGLPSLRSIRTVKKEISEKPDSPE